MGADYGTLGLTSNLQSESSLAVQGTYVTSLEVDSNFESVGAAVLSGGKIKTRLVINDGTVDRIYIGEIGTI